MNNTQGFVPIEDINENLVFLKDGGVSLVISTSAVNFALLFETEQISIITSFAQLLNSLSFPIQITINSRRLDVSSYLTVLDQAEKTQSNFLLKNMISHYKTFVESLIKEKNVLDKKFYVCITASPLEFGILPKNFEERLKKASFILNPRKDHIIRQLSRIGLKAKQLTTAELAELYYNLYNPDEFSSKQAAVPIAATPIPVAPKQTVPLQAPLLPVNQPTPTGVRNFPNPAISIPRPQNPYPHTFINKPIAYPPNKPEIRPGFSNPALRPLSPRLTTQPQNIPNNPQISHFAPTPQPAYPTTPQAVAVTPAPSAYPPFNPPQTNLFKPPFVVEELPDDYNH